MERICVFCGSSPGASPTFVEAGRRFGSELARRKLGLVYGGGRLGVMGAVADAVLAAGGHATGVMPRGLFAREVVHPGLSDLREVDSLHQRKTLMCDLADAFVALPGGIGTMDEWFEAWTWAQLGIHRKPLALLNVGGYFDLLLDFVDQMVRRGFLPAADRARLLVESEEIPLLGRLAALPTPFSAPGPAPAAP
jgi:uncharacterized protein (TIGR00730 family)